MPLITTAIPDDRYGLSWVIGRRIALPLLADPLRAEEWIARTEYDAKRQGALEIFDMIYACGTPVVVDSHMETWMDYEQGCMCFKLHYRLVKTMSMNYTIMNEVEVFTYYNHEGKQEWKCPACATINSMDAKYCGELHAQTTGCNRPREKVRQEM